MFRPYTGHHKPEKEFKQTHVTLARVLKMQLVQIQDRIQITFQNYKKKCFQIGRTKLWYETKFAFERLLNDLRSDGMNAFS